MAKHSTLIFCFLDTSHKVTFGGYDCVCGRLVLGVKVKFANAWSQSRAPNVLLPTNTPRGFHVETT